MNHESLKEFGCSGMFMVLMCIRGTAGFRLLVIQGVGAPLCLQSIIFYSNTLYTNSV